MKSWHPALRLRPFSRRLLSFSALVVGVCAAQVGNSQEVHLNEPGTGTLLSLSAFAHGYRHGYEEGYHVGNIDINMGRLARTADKKSFHGVKITAGYSASFGAEASFDAGFQAGLKAGYHDGYEGHSFRVVDSARALSTGLERELAPKEHAGAYFDQGVAAGYAEGFHEGEASSPEQRQIDVSQVKCPENGPASADQSTYCGGYRRGFVMGHTDALALRPGFVYLEASK